MQKYVNFQYRCKNYLATRFGMRYFHSQYILVCADASSLNKWHAGREKVKIAIKHIFRFHTFFVGPNDEQEGGNCSATHTGARPDHFGCGSVLGALCKLTYMLAKFRGNNI